MSILVYRINDLLSRILSEVGIGTNLDLFALIWTILSGRLLESRGGVFPALASFGLPDAAVRRAWAALARGSWRIADLNDALERVILEEGRWKPSDYGGLHPVAADLTAFFRPKLKNCPTKHYSAAHGKALPAIPVGLLGRVGSANGKRLAVPVAIVRADPGDPSERALHGRLLATAKERLRDDEMLVVDRGFPLAELTEAGIERYVARLPKNFTARRADPPAYPGFGRPAEKGEIVRPLARAYRGRTIAATPSDREETWAIETTKGSVTLRAEIWEELTLVEKPEVDGKEGAFFRVVAIHDPRYADPLLVATPEDLATEDLRLFYLDRWPIEGPPLQAKQMLGAARQFVFAPESVQRLPELALFAGSLLSYLAATSPAVPAGFWDRSPKATAGRLRRLLASVTFEDLGALPRQFRKKDSPTAHLPKGTLGHRRHKSSGERPPATAQAA